MGRAEGQVVAGAVLQTSKLSRGRPDLGMRDAVGDDDSQLPLHMSSVESNVKHITPLAALIVYSSTSSN
jgi:hypothetical protein